MELYTEGRTSGGGLWGGESRGFSGTVHERKK